jgi:hypothetical protein
MPLSISALLIADLLVVLDGTPSRLSAAHHSAAALPKRVWIATDPDHTARAVLNAQIALGPCGIQLGPLLPPPSPAERRKLLRDALRLQLWRATGSTDAWLEPNVTARKRAACGL